jgi:hypothetical protein
MRLMKLLIHRPLVYNKIHDYMNDWMFYYYRRNNEQIWFEALNG